MKKDKLGLERWIIGCMWSKT